MRRDNNNFFLYYTFIYEEKDDIFYSSAPNISSFLPNKGSTLPAILQK